MLAFEKLNVYFLDSSDTTLKEITLTNNVHDSFSIKNDILHFQQIFQYEKIWIKIECTLIYSFNQATFSSEDFELKSLNTI